MSIKFEEMGTEDIIVLLLNNGVHYDAVISAWDRNERHGLIRLAYEVYEARGTFIKSEE